MLDLHRPKDEWIHLFPARADSYEQCIYSDSFLMDQNGYAGMPCWQEEFKAFEEEYQAWNTKYYIILNENGEVLFSELSLNGNGWLFSNGVGFVIRENTIVSSNPDKFDV